MTAAARGNPTGLDLSREEAWVVHSALLSYIEGELADDRRAEHECDLLRALEGDAEFDDGDLRAVRRAVDYYRERAPDRDRDPCRSVLDRVALALA